MTRKEAILKVVDDWQPYWVAGRVLRKQANELLPWWKWMSGPGFYRLASQMAELEKRDMEVEVGKMRMFRRYSSGIQPMLNEIERLAKECESEIRKAISEQQ